MVRFLAALQRFYDELKRRHVFRVAAAYVVGAFFVLEASNLLVQGLDVPDWVYRTITILALVGFPVVLVLAWLFQWTSAGIRREDEPVATEGTATVDGVAQAPRAVGSVRAFAFVGLGIVIAIVAMGLSLPYMYSQREHRMTQQAQREGVVLATDGAPARLAVLPFVSLTGVDDEGFADGLAEDITATLAQVEGMDVVSRTTSESYRDSEKTAREIAAELGVGHILEGTVRRAGDQIRVTVQLIDARTDRHLWANSYDRTLSDGDVFATQTALAQDIVTAIESVVYPARVDQAESRRVAFDMANKGSQLLSFAQPVYDAAAENLFVQSLDRDSANAVAHAGLAQTQVLRAQNGSPELIDSAAHHAQLAVALAPEKPDGHAAHAFVLMVQGKMDSAAVALRRAVELDVSGRAFDYEWEQRIRMISPEALEQARQAIEDARRRAEESAARDAAAGEAASVRAGGAAQVNP